MNISQNSQNPPVRALALQCGTPTVARASCPPKQKARLTHGLTADTGETDA